MIKSVTVTNHRNESIEMILREPEKSGFVIAGIEGLNPPKANINTTDLVTADGSVYNSARMEARNIVLTLKFLGDPSIEARRELSYKYFPIKKQVRLQFKTDLRECYIYGYVESNESEIFSSQCATQISVMCPNPYFYEVGTDTTLFSGTVDEFEFPITDDFDDTVTYHLGDLCIYSGDVYRCIVAASTPGTFYPNQWDDDPTILDSDIGQLEFPSAGVEFSEIRLDTICSIDYSGEIDTGIVVTINFLDGVSGIRIWNYYTGDEMRLDTNKIASVTGGAIQTGDVITISTIKGDKYITLLRGGVAYNILNCLNKDATWFTITIGINTFCYSATTGVYNMQLSIENPILIQGI